MNSIEFAPPPFIEIKPNYFYHLPSLRVTETEVTKCVCVIVNVGFGKVTFCRTAILKMHSAPEIIL